MRRIITSARWHLGAGAFFLLVALGFTILFNDFGPSVVTEDAKAILSPDASFEFAGQTFEAKANYFGYDPQIDFDGLAFYCPEPEFDRPLTEDGTMLSANVLVLEIPGRRINHTCFEQGRTREVLGVEVTVLHVARELLPGETIRPTHQILFHKPGRWWDPFAEAAPLFFATMAGVFLGTAFSLAATQGHF